MSSSKRTIRKRTFIDGTREGWRARHGFLKNQDAKQDASNLTNNSMSNRPIHLESSMPTTVDTLQGHVLSHHAFRLDTISSGSSAVDDLMVQDTPSDRPTLSNDIEMIDMFHSGDDEDGWDATIPQPQIYVPGLEERPGDRRAFVYRSFRFSTPLSSRKLSLDTKPSSWERLAAGDIPFSSASCTSESNTQASSPEPQLLTPCAPSTSPKPTSLRTRLYKLYPKRALDALRKPRVQPERFAKQNARWKQKFEQQDALLRQVSEMRNRLISPQIPPTTPHFPTRKQSRGAYLDRSEDGHSGSMEAVSQARLNAPLPPLPESEEPLHQPQQICKSSAIWSSQAALPQAKENKVVDFWEVTQRTLIKVRLPAKRGRQFKVGGILGVGAFGTVFLVYHVAKRKEAAVKCIKYTQGLDPGSCRGIINELKVLRALATQKIQSRFLLGPYLDYDFWAWRSSMGYVHILTDYCPGGPLSNYIMSISRDAMPLVIGEIALGLEHLHGSGIIHHDIKPDNIFVDRQGHCVISDFGGARFLRNGRPDWAFHEPPTYTLSYAAPELLILEDYDTSVDYWSLGITIAELLIGEDGIPRGHYSAIFEDLAKIRHALEDSVDCSLLIELVFELLQPLAGQRLKGPAVRSHKYFAVLQDEWREIREGKYPPFKFEVDSRQPPVYGRGAVISQPSSVDGPERHDLLRMMEEDGLRLECHDEFDVAAQLQQLSMPLD